MEQKKSLGLTIGISFIPFLIGVIIVELICRTFFGVGRPFDNDFTIASFFLPLVGVYVAISKEGVKKVLRFVIIGLSVVGGLLAAAANVGDTEYTFIRSLFMIVLCFQIYAIDYVHDFVCKKFPGAAPFTPLINFALLTILGIPTTLLGMYVAKFFGFWLPFLGLLGLTGYKIYSVVKGSKGSGKKNNGGGSGGYSSGKGRTPTEDAPIRQHHLRDPNE